MLQLPEADRLDVEKELASEEGLSAENASRLMNLHNHFSPKKNKAKGCFGKRGTSRKEQIRESQSYLKQALKEYREKAEEEYNTKNESVAPNHEENGSTI